MRDTNSTTLYDQSKETKTRLLWSDSQKPSNVIMIVIFGARLTSYAVINRPAVTWLMADADITDFFAHKYQDLYTSVSFNVNDMDEIRSDLSAYIQEVSG